MRDLKASNSPLPLSTTTTRAVTHCGCSKEKYLRFTKNDHDVESNKVFSGAPAIKSITQAKGKIKFTFMDNSRCSEGTAFSRKIAGASDSDSVAFAPNYNFYDAKNCKSRSTIAPNDLIDDIIETPLEVYQNYSYCARAVGMK